MTIREMFQNKYEALQGLKNPVWWSNARYYAEAKKMTLEQYCYMSLEITVNDIKACGGYTGELWSEITKAHEEKLLASNAHRQDARSITKYWLTKKGYKSLICRV